VCLARRSQVAALAGLPFRPGLPLVYVDCCPRIERVVDRLFEGEESGHAFSRGELGLSSGGYVRTTRAAPGAGVMRVSCPSGHLTW
jgi:hypothetical protein